MEEIRKEDDGRYRGSDLMNPQKRHIFQRLKEVIEQEKGELVYFLNLKDINSEKHDRYQKELEYLVSTNQNPERRKRLEQNIAHIHRIQGDIFRIMQPMFHEMFDVVAKEISPGISYNEDLRTEIRFDLVF